MKKKIAVFGSTGSIGKTTIDIIKKDKNNFEVILLTSNNNTQELVKQAKELNVKNLIINNKKQYLNLKKKFKNKKINIYNNFHNLNKIFKKKIDYTMCAISGLQGLSPTLNVIEFTKNIAIANKESLICGWNLIEKKLKRYNTKFIPVDSEHFSIWSLIKNVRKCDIEEVIITASGGPFLKLPISKFNTIKPSSAIKHPNWNMGKKISIDSATMMNKVFEVIEAQRIFDIELKKFKILIHQNSYVHSIVKFNNGTTKILVHDTNMKIPIFNTLYQNSNKKLMSKKLDITKLNNLNLKNIDKKKFPIINILNYVSKKFSLYETVIVSANDLLVQLFLEDKIKFLDISKYLKKIVELKEFKKFKRILPTNVNQVIKLSKYVRLKTQSLSVIVPKP
jgi:1-deoxy-D-xylulose-5-phosphate reductoisomerase